MDKYRKLGKNILLLLTGNFVTKILSFLMVPFYTSILSTSDYGTADLISTTVLLVLPCFSLLMDEAIMRFVLDTSKNKKQVFSIAITVSSVGFLIAMCVSPIILLIPVLKQYYWFVVLYYISLWLYNIFLNYVKGLDKFSIVAIAGIIHTFVYLAINIFCLVILELGVYGYLLAIDLSNLIAAMYLFFFCGLYKDFIPIRMSELSLVKEMALYSIPMIPDYILWWVNNASDRYILAIFCGTGITGVYSVAYKIPTILNSITSICSSAWKISSVDQFGTQESLKFFNRIYRMYCSFLTITASGLVICTKVLAKILFAKDFFEAWKITPILVLGYVFSAQAIFLGSIFTASKKTKGIFFASTAGAIVNIVLNFILIPYLGGTGAAIATSIGYFVILNIDIILTRGILPIDFLVKRNIITYILIILEILFILVESIWGYLMAVVCTLIVILIHIKEFIKVVKILLTNIRKEK